MSEPNSTSAIAAAAVSTAAIGLAPQCALIFAGALLGGLSYMWTQETGSRIRGAGAVIKAMCPAVSLAWGTAKIIHVQTGWEVYDVMMPAAWAIAVFHERLIGAGPALIRWAFTRGRA